MATNYQRGAAFELRVKKRLEEQGWTVWRTPGSKSPADLVAIRPNTERREHVAGLPMDDSDDGLHWLVCCDCGRKWAEHDSGKFAGGDRWCAGTDFAIVRLVQCKSGAKGMTKAARAEFRAFAESLGAEAYVWSRGMKEEAA